jgi:hypothetical protein
VNTSASEGGATCHRRDVLHQRRGRTLLSDCNPSELTRSRQVEESCSRVAGGFADQPMTNSLSFSHRPGEGGGFYGPLTLAFPVETSFFFSGAALPGPAGPRGSDTPIHGWITDRSNEGYHAPHRAVGKQGSASRDVRSSDVLCDGARFSPEWSMIALDFGPKFQLGRFVITRNAQAAIPHDEVPFCHSSTQPRRLG